MPNNNFGLSYDRETENKTVQESFRQKDQLTLLDFPVQMSRLVITRCQDQRHEALLMEIDRSADKALVHWFDQSVEHDEDEVLDIDFLSITQYPWTRHVYLTRTV